MLLLLSTLWTLWGDEVGVGVRVRVRVQVRVRVRVRVRVEVRVSVKIRVRAINVASELAVELNSLEKNSSKRSWQQCTEWFFDELRERTQGIFGHYSMIIALDGVLVSRPALTKVCCWWPMLCTAYVSGLPAVYPGIGRTQEELFAAPCHFHRKMREEFPKMSISECLAQLCWKKRGATSVPHV